MGLRPPLQQTWLAELAACPNVHLIASADRPDVPLLWGKSAAAKFNWLYCNVTNFEPSFAETMDYPPLLSSESLIFYCVFCGAINCLCKPHRALP